MRRILFALSLVGVVGATACAPKAFVPNPPVPLPSGPRSELVVQKTFRVGTLDFGDHAGDGETSLYFLNKALPAAILTELKATGRFSVYEAGAIREKGLFNERDAGDIVDAYLSGKITRETEREVCFDVWLSNSHSHEVLYAKSTCAALTSLPEPQEPAKEAPKEQGREAGTKRGLPVAVSLSREAIRPLAEDIARSVKQVGRAEVTSVSGRLVYVNRGKDADVMAGMVAYVLGTGDTVKNEAVHRTVEAYTRVKPTGMPPRVVAQIYIISVEKNYSIGQLAGGDYALPGDTVFFK